jgi:hypothetical protein
MTEIESLNKRIETLEQRELALAELVITLIQLFEESSYRCQSSSLFMAERELLGKAINNYRSASTVRLPEWTMSFLTNNHGGK